MCFRSASFAGRGSFSGRALGARRSIRSAVKRVVPGVAILVVLLSAITSRASAQVAAVGGVVRDLHGTPQMGALVELLGPDAAVLARTFTDDHGRYLLSPVAPGRYQLRASAAFLLPVLRSNLRLNPGVRAVANLTMTAIFEVGVWFPAEKRTADEPADDWRWTLRSSAGRPMLRWTSDPDPDTVSSSAERRAATVEQERYAVFSGDGRFADGGPHQVVSVDRSEMNGDTEVLHADIGEPLINAVSGMAPSVSADAGYERSTVLGGESRMVMGYESQPELAASGATGLQAVNLATSERLSLGDAVMIDAGTLLSAERLMESRVSSAPFLRIIVTPGTGLAVMYRFAAGRTVQSSDDLNSVDTMPVVLSDSEGRPVALNGTHQELAISKTDERNTATVAVYQDNLPVDALQGTGNLTTSEIAGLPVIADASTGTFHMAVDGYTARGISMSWTRVLAPALAACVEADLGTALVRNGSVMSLADPESGLVARATPAVSGSVHGTIARTGTTFRAQYRWQPKDAVDEVNAYNVASEQAYLSMFLRQRLWSGHRLQGLDAVLEATNLLEEGYQPIVGPDGETLFLAQVPRALQAGLSFSF